MIFEDQEEITERYIQKLNNRKHNIRKQQSVN